MKRDAPARPASQSATPAEGQQAVVPSHRLLGPRGALRIEHSGELYTLRRTRNGKLILTK